ncbi:MAG: hypothetical protein ACR2LA_05225 [Acidimicrobiales bacterium]
MVHSQDKRWEPLSRQQALTEGTTLRALVADSLRARLEDSSSSSRTEGVEVEVYGGSGLADGVTGADLFAREERDLRGAWPDALPPGAAPQ